MVPIFVALVALQANLTATVYLRSQGSIAASRVIDVATGLGSMLGSALGPAPICRVSLLTPLKPARRRRSGRCGMVGLHGRVVFLVIALGAASPPNCRRFCRCRCSSPSRGWGWWGCWPRPSAR